MSEPGRLRIAQFDALRGLAACCVVIHHFLLTVRNVADPAYVRFYDWKQALGLTPLRLLWEGHAAVVLFFALSGFVLYLMLERTRLPFTAYAAKRVVRLYIPYLAAIALGIAGQHWLYDGGLTGLGDWINKFWTQPLDAHSLCAHLLFLGAFDSSRYDFTIWTLVHEMRISLLFPLIFLLVRRWPWWRVLTAFAAASLAMASLRIAYFNGHQALGAYVRHGGFTAYAYTVHYLLAFAVGALLAAYRAGIGAVYAALPGRSRGLLCLLALTLYLYGGEAMHHLTGLAEMMVGDWLLLAGAGLLLVVCAFEPRVERNLDRAPLLYLGRVSYSLYLFHPLVLLAALHLAYGRVPLGWLLAVAFGACFVVADLAYRAFERPATRLARRVGDAIGQRRRESGSVAASGWPAS